MVKPRLPPLSRRIHVGTSGWTYDDWNGPFYPPEVRGAERLAYYARYFDSVEVNATFYRFPGEAMINAWNRNLGPDFHLVVKAHRLVTHRRRLRDCALQVKDFLKRVEALRALRVVLWQLPPDLERDVGRLDAFLRRLPGGRAAHAFEFRHASWWHPDVQACLAAHGAAFVAVSHPRLPAEILPTGALLYVRFHGCGRRLYDYDYSRRELREWAERLRPALRGRSLYAFFNNDVHANAPRDAADLREILLRKRASGAARGSPAGRG
jgi:uncharacterized protein YecE (DUF72 family)